MLNPLPLTDAALTVSAVVPDEVSVTDPLAVPPTATVPKLTLGVLSVSVGIDAPRLMAKLWVPPPEEAVSVAVCAVLTVETVAMKLAVVDPAATITEDGSVTAAALLERLTAWPPVLAAAFSVTVQGSVPGPVIEPIAQLNWLG